MAEAFVQVNTPTDPDPSHKLKTFTSLDGNGNSVHSEAVVPTDSGGHEIRPLTDAQLRATPIPVTDSSMPVEAPTGLGNGTQTAVSDTAVIILAANSNRLGIVIQNVGLANIRIGVIGVTETTGIQLRPGGTITFEPPFLSMGAIYAIREGSVDSTAFTAEVT